ncbi:PD40 domain-containing protein [Aulosira sp. FACHB-615]|uniref:WD40 domain-containing protein n=1 Tax=Aulosira sp. FACHB-615 TaxID=2692777 RepID=UPI0016885215|nr:PD40 domain-containing protein [Aulosira sp. FACHB-615]MBD2486111.1 PD40 domain-containing protein [Aulosira sp. FACHB-615]
MTLDLQKFYQACNPSKTLAVENAEDRKYYIDFSSVRGGRIIEELKENITFFSPHEPTCELFTGHIGCGKSTELLRLKAELEAVGYQVAYFESSQDLEMSDVDIGDILLAIARRVTESLDTLEKQLKIPEPRGLKKIIEGAAKLVQVELEWSAEFTIGIGKITAKAKNSPEFRSKLREYLGPRTKSILDVINEELIESAIASADLINFIEQTADEIFTKVLAAGAGRYLDQVALNLQIGSSRRVELEAAANELQNRRLSLSLELEASLEFMLGRATANFMEESRQHYERSLALFEQTDQFLERHAAVLYSLGIWWSTFAVLYLPEQESSRATSTEYLQKCVAVFEQANRRDLVAKFINALGVVLQQLQRWDELEAVANKALTLHQIYEHPLKLARAYSFKAEVALAKSMPDTAKAAAEQALNLLDNYQRNIQQPVSEETKADLEWENSYHRGWYLFALGRSQAALNQPELALQTLEIAKTDTKAQYDPELYIGILAQLRDNYFKKGEYLTAFNIKQYRRSIEQQYSYRAFIGAGRLQPQQQVNNPALALAEKSDTVAQEIAASGRQSDINRLIERMGRHDHKLTIIHGQSGVGKSSILQAGLIPALKQKPIGTRDVLPILQQVYPGWLRELGDRLREAIANLTPFALKPYEGEEIPIFNDKNSILDQFVKHDDYNLVTVLIFDQFEEFFFVYKDPASRKPFYEFLRECLDIPFVKVILSLREDYLYYLLECNNRLADFEVINNNILDKDILYYLDNFSPEDARAVIHILTVKTPFVFEPSLVDELVKDLARDLGEVRPIELQVVGVQLQTERITKLEQYQEQGPKEKFVGRFLEEIVQDCGTENEQISKLVLYLLTDENNLRPLKNRADLELELEVKPEKLDLILEILIKSGLIFKVPAIPADRYQLVHDYLVPFVRQQQSERLIKELEKEREQRKLTEAKLNEVLKQQLLETRRGLLWKVSLGTIAGALAIFLPLIFINQNNAQLLAISSNAKSKLNSNRDLEALIETIKAGKRLKQWWSIGVKPETEMQVKTALQDVVYTIREVNTLEGNADSVTKVSFSHDGQKIVSGSADGTLKIWSRDGKEIFSSSVLDKKITYIDFSPDSQIIVAGSVDGKVILKNLKNPNEKNFNFQAHEEEITNVSFSPDGQKLLTASKDKTIKLWSLDGKELKIFRGHQDSISSVSFSPDGQLIASSSQDNTVKLWNLDAQPIQNLKFKNSVNQVVFSPDSQIIASVEENDELKLWRRNGSLLNTFFAFGGQRVRFGLDGKTIALATVYSDSTRVTIYNTDKTDEQAPTLTFDLTGHRNKITSISISPDLQMVASGSEDRTVKLWNIQKNNNFKSPNTYSGLNISFSPDSQLIAFVSDKVQLWQQDNILRTTLPGDNSEFSFGPNNQTLVTASEDILVQLWRKDGNFVKTLQGNIVSGSFSPDGQTIALVKDDNHVELLTSDGKHISTLKGIKHRVSSIIFSSDSETLATLNDGKNQIINIWRRNGNLIKSLNGYSNYTLVGFNHNGDILILAGQNKIKFIHKSGKEIKNINSVFSDSVNFSDYGERLIFFKQEEEKKLRLELWNTNGTFITTLPYSDVDIEKYSYQTPYFIGKPQAIVYQDDQQIKFWTANGSFISKFDSVNKQGYQISPDGQIIVTREEKNIIKLWKRNGIILNTIQLKTKKATAKTITFSSDSKKLAITTNQNTIEIWHTDGHFIKSINTWDNSKVKRLKSDNPENQSYDTPLIFDSDILITRTQENQLGLWKFDSNTSKKVSTAKYINKLGNLVKGIYNVNQNIISTNSSIDTVKIWQIPKKVNKEAHLLNSIKGHSNQITSLAISPDSKLIASASKDNTVKIWQRDGRLLSTFKEHKDNVNSVSFSPDGKLIASASDDTTVKVWQPNGEVVKSFEEHGNVVTNVSFSPDGKLIASASRDNTVKIWSLNNQEITTLNNDYPVTSISFSPDSKMIASADYKTVKIWSIDGILLSTYERFGKSSVSFSPDGKSIASATGDNGISVWDLDLNQLLKQGCDAARDYLQNNPKAESDRHLCDDIYNQK